MRNNFILNEMGIQQWRLREPQTVAVETTSVVAEALLENAPHNVDAAPIVTNLPEVTVTEAKQTYDWSRLIELLSDKHHCGTCAEVTPILGDGDPQADWMFVFDSPTQRDIDQQRLLTGRIGQLFDAILMSIGLTRDTVYLCSIFKCPPPADISSGVAQCDDLLQHQIELVQPKVVIGFGEFVAKSLIKANEGLDQLRQQSCRCFNYPVTVIPTHGLMQMLDTPMLKKEVWEDLKRAIGAVER